MTVKVATNPTIYCTGIFGKPKIRESFKISKVATHCSQLSEFLCAEVDFKRF